LQVVNGMFSTTTGRIDDRWRRFMQFQIKRTRDIFASAEAGVDQLAPDARLPVW
jgi:15-cis-phytoene synthase